MLTRMSLVILLLVFCLAGQIAHAAPKFKVNATVTAAEKGHPFEILVVIDTDEALSEITIAPVPPRGFPITATATPGLEVMPDHVKIAALSAGDSFTVPFLITAPAQWGYLNQNDALYSTRDPKVFSFNITYKAKGKDSQEITVHQTESISLRYTTSLFLYLLSGLLGVLLGFIVKTITQNTKEIDRLMVVQKKFLGRVGQLVRYVMVLRLPFLLTTAVIGFGVLLSMAQDKIPVNGWFQATALGIGLGILSDEKLITKLRSGGSSGDSTEQPKKKGDAPVKESEPTGGKEHKPHR